MGRNPLRWLYGGSNRLHHLRLSSTLSGALATLAPLNPGIELGGYWWQFPHGGLWLAAAIACYSQEWWATADRDIEPSRSWWWGHWYWLPFGGIRHRNRLSHGLIVGTGIRLVYGWWWFLPVLWLLSPWAAVAWCLGALVNDVGHIFLDF
jgi:uncharacterized metal-binding protein